MAGGPTQSGVAGGLSEMRSEARRLTTIERGQRSKVQEVDDQRKRSEAGASIGFDKTGSESSTEGMVCLRV